MAKNSKIISTTRRKCDIEKDETIERIKQEYRNQLVSFKEYYLKICIHLSTLPYVFDEFDSASSINTEEDYPISEIEEENTQQQQPVSSVSL